MRKLFRIIFLLVLSSTHLSAQTVRTEPENYWLSTKTWVDPLTSSQLIESSLAASGLTGDRLIQYKNIYKQVIENFTNDLGSSFKKLSAYDQGDFILNWAHKNILKHYVEQQTLMDTLIDTGNFNCVSSAIFYLILSKEAGLITGIIETRDHAFCRVQTDGGWVDVETTTAYGFDPGVKKEFQQSFNQTGYSYVPPGNYQNRKKIGDKETVALILQNRMSALQKHNYHDQTIGLAIDRWTLSGDRKSHKDMNDAFRNWSAVLNNHGKYKEAYYFLSKVSQKYNLSDTNKDLLYNLAYNQIITMTKEKNYDGAKTFLHLSSDILNMRDQIKLKNLLTREQIADRVKNGSYMDSLPLVREAYKTGGISKSEWQNWITVLHQNKALSIAQDTGWWNAWQFLRALPSEEQVLSSIKDSTGRAHDNWSFEIHNQYADLFNSKRFVDARQLLIKELAKDPGNKYLSKDLSDLKKMLPQ